MLCEGGAHFFHCSIFVTDTLVNKVGEKKVERSKVVVLYRPLLVGGESDRRFHNMEVVVV